MKHLVLLLLPLAVAGCSGKYPSATEARVACDAWVAKGGNYEVEVPKDYLKMTGWHWMPIPVRRCQPDPAGVILGMGKETIEAGDRFDRTQYKEHDALPKVVLERFRY